jgi:hypothetical protein
MAKETYHMAKETYHMAKETYHMAKETYHMAKETYHMAKETYHMAKETYHMAKACHGNHAKYDIDTCVQHILHIQHLYNTSTLPHNTWQKTFFSLFFSFISLPHNTWQKTYQTCTTAVPFCTYNLFATHTTCLQHITRHVYNT